MKTQRAFLTVGGVNPPSVQLPPGAVANASFPVFALLPMRQHSGPPARCLVRVGDRVQEGMLIGKAEGTGSANVHSPIPGTVAAVGQSLCADGTASLAALVEFGGEFARTGKTQKLSDWEKLSRADLLHRVESCGVVGLGGSLLPTHLKLSHRSGGVLIGNGIESEPSLHGDVSLMREKSREIAIGMRICQKVLDAARVVLVIGQLQEEELAPLFQEAFAGCAAPWFETRAVAARYPQGHEDLVKAAVLAKGTLSNGSAKPEAKTDCVVLNVATLYAVYEAVVTERPLIERFVTVTGSAVRAPRVLKVRFGTRVGDLFEECGGLVEPPGKVVLGGPMRGISVTSLDFPVTKGVSGVVALTKAEAHVGPELPCIRCGACVEVCPWGLVPTRLHKLVEQGNLTAAIAEGLSSCTECGCCAFACPSRIPLVESLRNGRRLATASNNG